jgi:L-ribulose-5-phosphate 4-epimerase
VSDAAAALQRQVAWACRILALHGHGDLTLGHVSARSGDRVLMKRKGLGLEEVAPGDIVALDLDGRKLDGHGAVHLEAPLHLEVYRARGDVGAIIHTHPLYTTGLAATGRRLEYLGHDALLFPEGLAVYEGSADLVMTSETGRAVAEALGRHRAVLLRNHGVLVVGLDLRWAVLGALTLERAVRLQVVAATLGDPRPIATDLVAPLHASKYREEFLDEYWAYWVRGVRRAGLDRGMLAARALPTPARAGSTARRAKRPRAGRRRG